MEATQDERVAYIVKVRRQHRQDVAKWVSYLVGAHSVYRNLLVGRWWVVLREDEQLGRGEEQLFNCNKEETEI